MRRSIYIKARPEREILIDARTNPEARAELQWYVDLLVTKIAEPYAEKYTVPLDELSRIGMTYFDLALDKYLAKNHSKLIAGKPYKFTTYFTWWIEQSIETYLDLTDQPLKRIPRNKRNQK